MTHTTSPLTVPRILNRLQNVRPTRDGWVASCPCANHNPTVPDGDQNPSLGITRGYEGRILVKCRVGCPTNAILDALGLGWPDLFPAPGEEIEIPESLPPPGFPIPRDGDQTLQVHAAYDALLQHLPLGDDHRENLKKRGMDDGLIDRGGYRTLRNVNRGSAARKVYDAIGEAVLRVPGFVAGPYGITLAGDATGLLIPVRGLQGKIEALN